MSFLVKTFPVRPFKYCLFPYSPCLFRDLQILQKRFAGHNKWSKIKHKKGINDAKRGVIISRFTKEVITAVKSSKSIDPNVNPRLASLYSKARTLNIPKSTVETAIKKAQGPGVQQLTEAIYEATAFGTSFLIEVVTDNTNRVLGLIRHIMNKHGGSMANVQYMFQKKGVITCHASNVDQLLEDALDLGAEDLHTLQDSEHTILTPFSSMYPISEQLKQRGYSIHQVESTFVCEDEFIVQIPEDKKQNVQHMIEALDEIEDVVRVHHNAENLDEE